MLHTVFHIRLLKNALRKSITAALKKESCLSAASSAAPFFVEERKDAEGLPVRGVFLWLLSFALARKGMCALILCFVGARLVVPYFLCQKSLVCLAFLNFCLGIVFPRKVRINIIFFF